MRRARALINSEPPRYHLSLWLLVGMLLAYVIDGSTSGMFLVWILVVIGWFVLYVLAIGCAALAKAEDSFWHWYAGRSPD
jgi:hypothetical protein